MKISANQSTFPSVLFFNLLFYRWLEAVHRAFHYVNLSSMCSKQALYYITLSNVGFFIASQSVRISISFRQKPTPSKVLKLLWSLKIALTHTPLRALIEIAWNVPQGVFLIMKFELLISAAIAIKSHSHCMVIRGQWLLQFFFNNGALIRGFTVQLRKIISFWKRRAILEDIFDGIN